jgi:hypothetical protein
MTNRQIERINDCILWLKANGKEKVLYPLIVTMTGILAMAAESIADRLMG